MKKIVLTPLLVSLVIILSLNPLKADEGMWLPMLINGATMDDMKKKGLKLSSEDIYSVNNASLKDAIVSFGGYCTGEIISKTGLLLTNHHCGYGAIQKISSVENDYLGNGFWAQNYDEEIPSEGLFVDFLIEMKDVTAEVLDSIDYKTSIDDRTKKINKKISEIKKRELDGTNFWAEIKPFYGGSEFYLFKYERYNDVRLVGTPPESIGKYGGDTDNWMWPRHTGDFALFRVYTDSEGKPANYSKDNIPLVPKHHLPISLDGVKDNDFTMVLGYPGSTDRYLSSYGVKLAINLYNPTVVKVRKAKLDILNEYMKSDRNINIMYSSKKARISNYWKYYIGQTRGLKKLNVYDKKVGIESEFNVFANSSEQNKAIYGDVLSDMEKSYSEIEKLTLSRIYLNEAAWSGPSFIRLARRSEKFTEALESGNDSIYQEAKTSFMNEVVETFKDYKKEVDMDIFVKMMEMYYENVPKDQMPEIVTKMAKKYKNNFKKWGEIVYSKSIFVDESKMMAFLKNPSAKQVKKDPAFLIQKSILDNYFNKILPSIRAPRQSLEVSNRLFVDGLRKMYPQKAFYPDANFTMRLTYGTIGDYSPGNAIMYDYTTTFDGVIEKMDNDNPEFIVSEKLVKLYKDQNFGPYANEDGELNICFISNNDITGGNSGSPVINSRGELIGCAFDGNWEAMSGDIAFEDQLQRTISVDVRYILFIIDYYAEAKHIIDELTLVKTSDKEMDRIKKEETQSLINTINELIKEFPEIIKSENTSSDELSFSKAFLKARNLKKDFFSWKNKTYSTELEVVE